MNSLFQRARLKRLGSRLGISSALSLFLLAGCNSEPPLPPLAPVTGKVTVEGQPLTTGQITLVNASREEGQKAPISTGTIGADGNYEVFTAGKKGAPLGKYKVAVSPSMVPMEGAKGAPKTSFHEKYRTPEATTLLIDVVGSPQPGAYDLKLKK